MSEVVLVVLGLMTAVVLLVSAVLTAVLNWRTNRKVAHVHELVNSRFTEMELRVADLTAALQRSDTDVPPIRQRS